jgi:hypothetical protein
MKGGLVVDWMSYGEIKVGMSRMTGIVCCSIFNAGNHFIGLLSIVYIGYRKYLGFIPGVT